MSAHQSPPYHPTLVNLRTAPWAEIDGALRHWRGWRLTPALSEEPRHPQATVTARTPPEANAELPGMWEQADFIDTSEAPKPASKPPAGSRRISLEDLNEAHRRQAEALRRAQALTPGVRIPADAITSVPPTPTQRPPAPTGTNETDFPGMALPSNADKRLTEAIRLIAMANKAPDNDSAIGHTLRALAQVISTIAVPRCCEGGPQWGHAWTCDTLP